MNRRIAEAESFGLEPPGVKRQAREGSNTENITEFLTPPEDGPPPPKLMVYHQPPFQRNAQGEWSVAEGAAKRLVFTTTDSEGLAEKATYFIRMNPFEELDLSKGNDDSLVCGEVSKHLLQDIEASLNQVYSQLLLNRDGE